MTTPEIFRMLEDARSFGIGVYNAWTAEPLLRPDLPDVLKHAKDLGLTTSLITNGKILAERVQDLKDLDYLSVSLDGIKSNRELRGLDYEDVLKGIKAARAAGHEVLLNCVISGKNVSELGELVQLARELGTLISFEPLNQSGNVDNRVWEDLKLNDVSEYEKAMDDLIRLKRSGAPIINSETYLRMVKRRAPEFRCHASDIVLHVASDGTFENCRLSKEPLGSVSDGLLDVWNSSRDKRKRIVSECDGCLFFGYVENSMLYDFVPEVMAHYRGM